MFFGTPRGLPANHRALIGLVPAPLPELPLSDQRLDECEVHLPLSKTARSGEEPDAAADSRGMPTRPSLSAAPRMCRECRNTAGIPAGPVTAGGGI